MIRGLFVCLAFLAVVPDVQAQRVVVSSGSYGYPVYRSGLAGTGYYYSGYPNSCYALRYDSYSSPYYAVVSTYTPPAPATVAPAVDKWTALVNALADTNDKVAFVQAIAASGLRVKDLPPDVRQLLPASYGGAYATYSQNYGAQYNNLTASGSTVYAASVDPLTLFAQNSALLEQQREANDSRGRAKLSDIIGQISAIREQSKADVALVKAALRTPDVQVTQSSSATVPVQPQQLQPPQIVQTQNQPPPIQQPAVQPMPDASGKTSGPIDRNLLASWSKSAQRCTSCHSGATAKGKFDIGQYPAMTTAAKAEVVKLLLLPANDPRHMPKAVPGAATAESVPLEEIGLWTDPRLGGQ